MTSQSPYEHGRLARSQGCYRGVIVATDEERSEWLRGYDEMGAELQAVVEELRPVGRTIQ